MSTQQPTVFLCSAGAGDAPLAEALEAALPRFARSWRRRAGIQVVRSGDPAAADWFLLVASPESASADAVDAAVRTRVQQRGVEQFQVVVTDGTWVWDQAANQLDMERSTAAPSALATAFAREPRHMVFRGDRTHEISPRDLVFREQVAEIVAPIRGLTKDEIFGEEVRHQQRTRQLTAATAASLSLLTVAAVVGAVVASAAASEANNQRSAAQEQRDIAAAERERAETERDNADSRRLAVLAGQASSTDGALARLLAIEAYRTAQTPEAEEAIGQAALTTDAWSLSGENTQGRRLLGHESRPIEAAFSPDSASIATVDESSILRMWDLAATASPTEIAGVGAESLAWSMDGQSLAAATSGQLILFDPAGESAGAITVPGAEVGPWGQDGFVVAGPAVSLVEGGEVTVSKDIDELDIDGLAVDFVSGSEGGDVVVLGTREGHVLVLDDALEEMDRWQFTAVQDQLGEVDSRSILAFDGSDRVLMPPDNDGVLGPILGAQGPDAQDNAIAGIYDVRTGEAVQSLSTQSSYMPLPASAGAFLPDGEAIAVSSGGLESPPSLASSSEAPSLDTVPLPAQADLLRVSADGSTMLVGGDDGAATLHPLAATDTAGSTGETTTENAASGEAATDAADGGTSVAPADVEAAVNAACDVAGRNFSESEWATYLPDREYAATCQAFDAPHVVADLTGPALAGTDEDAPATDEDAPVSEMDVSGETATDEAKEQQDADSAEEQGNSASTDDPFAGIDLANSTYDIGCFIDEEALVEGLATDSQFGEQVELIEEARDDRDGDGIQDAVLTFQCTGFASLSIITLVLDGADPESFTVLSEDFELQ